MRVVMACVIAATSAAAAMNYRPPIVELPPVTIESPAQEVILRDEPPTSQFFGWIPPKVAQGAPAKQEQQTSPPQQPSKAKLQRRVTCSPSGCRVEWIPLEATTKASTVTQATCSSRACGSGGPSRPRQGIFGRFFRR